MIIGLAQYNPKVGDFKGNRQRIFDFIRRMREAGADLVVFPELSLSGYPPKDLLEHDSFIDANHSSLLEIASHSSGISVICGFVDRNPSASGPSCYNSAAFIQSGKVERVYHKQLLPNYSVFDERRYFQPGNEACIVSVKSKKIGITVCEDAWNFPGFLQRTYLTQPLQGLVGQGLDCVINISASPFHVGKALERVHVFHEAAKFVGAPFVVVNQVGGNDELLFDGCSFAVTPAGKAVVKGKAFEEDSIVFDSKILHSEKEGPPVWPTSQAECLHRALTMGLRDYVTKSGMNRVGLGLSGGIDSSVAAALAATALGPKSVIGVSLPTRFTSQASRDDARQLAKNLDIEFLEIPIDPLFERFEALWRERVGEIKISTTLENIQPRLRMTVLMALANERGLMILNTSNKSEIATGYATLYGDTAGGLSVLGDLLKRQVYELARYLNRNSEVIPKRIIDRAPTAELRAGQFDEETLPPYAVLDDLVAKAVEGRQGLNELKKLGYDKAHVDAFARLHAMSEYKRHQLPPVLRVSTRAFGVGRRMPMAAGNPMLDW